MRPHSWLATIACAVAISAAAAPLTDAEKRLLQSGMSAEAAKELGRSADASGFARIISIGDPALVRNFDYGMALGRIEVMPTEIEALVVRYFDDPKVGLELRAHRARYRTRALFDRHYARLQGAYRADEKSFEQILRTDLPGIEDEILKLAPKWPAQQGQPSAALTFVARRKHPAAVPLLIASLDASFQGYRPTTFYHPVLTLLVDYPSADAWRQANAEIERMRTAGRITDEQYAAAHRQLDPVLKDPDAAVARMKGREAYVAYAAKRDAIRPGLGEIALLKDSSPKEYVMAMAGWLERVEELGAEFRLEDADYEVAGHYASLGAFVRFRLQDPAQAVRYLEKSARGRDLVGQVLLAETYQLALRDKANALRAYELALDTASRQPPGVRITPYAKHNHPMNAFWREWLAAEVEYVRTGKPFAGRVSEPAIGGFWDVMGVWARVAAPMFPEWPVTYQQLGISSARAFGGPMASVSSWPEIADVLAQTDRKTLGARLAKVPPSRFSLFVTLKFVSVLPDADAILRELARHDPSGYWTTIALGTVAWHERAAGTRDGALADGTAEAMLGMAAPGAPNELAKAARRHMQSRTLQTVEKKP